MINLHYAHECPNIPELCSLTSYNSRIILIKIETYYSLNYAGTLGSSLRTYVCTVYLHVLEKHLM